MRITVPLRSVLCLSALALGACTVPDHTSKVASAPGKTHCQHAAGSLMCGDSDDQAVGNTNDPSLGERSDTPAH